MLLDEFGRPIGMEPFRYTAQWLSKEMEKIEARRRVDARLDAVRASVLETPTDRAQLGSVINVRIPERFRVTRAV